MARSPRVRPAWCAHVRGRVTTWTLLSKAGQGQSRKGCCGVSSSLCLSRPSHTLLHTLTRMSGTGTVPSWVWNLNAIGRSWGRCWCLPSVRAIEFRTFNTSGAGPLACRIELPTFFRHQMHSTCIVIHARSVYYKHSSCTCCQSHLRLLGCAFTQTRV
jgi:hypothetical protein